MVRRYVVCTMAFVLLPPFVLPNRTNICKNDWVGIANLIKHCLTISPKESEALSGRSAMSLNACWSRPIAVLDGKKREALRTFSDRKSRFTSFFDMLHTQSTDAAHLLVETDSVFAAPLTFPFVGETFRHTLRGPAVKFP